jgi:hypothetical protein
MKQDCDAALLQKEGETERGRRLSDPQVIEDDSDISNARITGIRSTGLLPPGNSLLENYPDRWMADAWKTNDNLDVAQIPFIFDERDGIPNKVTSRLILYL